MLVYRVIICQRLLYGCLLRGHCLATVLHTTLSYFLVRTGCHKNDQFLPVSLPVRNAIHSRYVIIHYLIIYGTFSLVHLILGFRGSCDTEHSLVLDFHSPQF